MRQFLARSICSALFTGSLAMACFAQTNKVRGVVTDSNSGETLVGAAVRMKDGTGSAVTDLDGRFELTTTATPPFVVTVTYTGYLPLDVEVKDLTAELKVKMATDDVVLQEAKVVAQRISDKQKQAPLTVETMDLIAIKEAPGGDFYESLGTLKGVDMTAASFGFKVINTRGFNSTSPVRSLQLIDGVDNQSPGLNFSLGNFLGASDLDVLKVDVIAGASTAYYGPGAFNGVIAMTTKSPWNFPGLSVSVKGGERNMLEAAVRWAAVSTDRKWAYKLNAYALRADDWIADNYAPTSDSPTGTTNPGRYDAVNVYGDEDVATDNNFTGVQGRRSYPGLGKFLRNGYTESDLVDYSTQNLKLGGSLHHMLADSTEVILASNFSTGSTVYQGDNRYRLKDIMFFQHRIELKKEGVWYARAYVTHEDAGHTYDIYTTALRMQQATGATGGANSWDSEYSTYWGNVITPQVNAMPGYITATQAIGMGWTQAQWIAWQDQFIQDNHAVIQGFHDQALAHTNNTNNAYIDPFLVPGTDAFKQKFEEVTNTRFTSGGSLFYDHSALAHASGEYRFKPAFGTITVGGSVREYLPNSAGTIFRDTGNVVLRNNEFGLVTGLEKKFMQDRLTTTLTLRMDKNQNFNALVSPALSMVYAKTPAHVWRVSFSSAIRNPTLADQYLYYNVGRALLLGNVDGQFENGRDSMFTIDSFNKYRDNGLQRSLLDYFHVDRLRPEQVRTIEIGYRGTHWKSVYIDLSAYNSWYADFIGYIIGLHADFPQAGNVPPINLIAYRVAANASSQVTTQGANIGAMWYRSKTTWSVNYSYNRLTSGADDPIIPAFNTPLNKFNIGLSTHDLKVPFSGKHDLGWGLNYKYVEGYTFTGSPQFTGPIPSYDMVDAQVNVKFPGKHLTVKAGVSNLFGLVPLFDKQVPDSERIDRAWNNDVYLVYGGPRVGRLAYLQLVYELDMR